MTEDRINKLEFHVSGITFAKFNKKNAVLLLKRSPALKLFPNMWECGGGPINFNESLKEAVKRKLREGAGVNVQVLNTPIGDYIIDAPDSEQKKIPGIYFACRFISYVNGLCPQLDENHTEWTFHRNLHNYKGYELIPGLKEEIRKAEGVFSTLYP